MNIEVRLEFTKRNIRDSIWFLSNLRKNYKKATRTNLIMAPITGVVALSAYFLTQMLPFFDSTISFLGNLMLYLALFVLMLAVIFWLNNMLRPAVTFCRISKQKEMPSQITFEDEIIVFQYTDSISPRKVQILYQALNKVYEVDEYFIVLLDIVGSSYVLNKRDFTAGSPVELRHLLRSKLGAKFIEKYN